MGIDTVENVCMLLSVTIGSLYALFKYIKTPKRGWIFLSVFFLMHLLSDYYWTIYTLVMGEDPDVSAFMAYFGWNIGYLFMLFLTLNMRPPEAKRFFHPLILIPIPLNIWQFFIYIQYGGIFNNIWEGVLATSIACFSLQVILYYLKNRATCKSFPFLHTVIFFFIVFEYGMWTSSCYDWSWAPVNPYYISAFLECVTLLLLGYVTNKEYEQMNVSKQEKSNQETRFAILLQITVAVIIFFGGVGGYYVGFLMKSSIPLNSNNPGTYKNIAITLFVISIVLVVFIMMIILMTALRYKSTEHDLPEEAAIKRGRYNFILTLIITFSLMIASVIYTSRLFYQVSVEGALEDGKSKVYSTTEELENYLAVARSILWVTADTVDIMLHNGESQDSIIRYIYAQTSNQAVQFDENFTGIYAYINGEYMDGSGWEPPADYRVENRDWYKEAVDAKGKTIIVSPYIDAQTGSAVITICKLLNDGGIEGDYKEREVVALDLVANHVTDITDEISIAGKGYGFIVSQDGMIITHHDHALNGKNVNKVYGENFMDLITTGNSSAIDATLDGENYTLFVDNVIDQWYVVIAISDKELFSETYSQLAVNIIVSLVIFLLISFFYYMGYKNEQLNAKKMEEMRSTDMRRVYEARILKQKEASATEANKAKSQFLAQMSHEIRTPINAVLGMNEMILRTTKDEQTLEYSRNIDSAGNTLLALINTILDFSKIEDGKMDIIPANYDTASFINDLVNSIVQRAEAKGLEFIPDIDETLPRTLYGDDVRLKQIIMNLLTNAVKYTESGSVRFTVKSAGKIGDKLQLYVSVKDTGNGIHPEDVDKLTLSFQRLDEKKNRNIEGTGLGMSIVSNLLSLMGSKICVDSTYGEGSNFYFTIEQGIVDETPIGDFADNTENRRTDRSNTDLINVPGARILVVDDNELNLMVATSLLKLCNIAPDEVSSGAETIQKMSENTYDIVFLDHMMPKMDGIETLHELKKQNLIPPGTKMVVLTANAVMGAKENYLNEGFDNYLSKPMEIKEMVSLLKEYLPDSAYTEDRPANPSYFDPEDDTIDTTDDANASNENTTEEDPVIKKLQEAGIDTDNGIDYCKDHDTYLEVLSFFTEEYATKSANINSCFENEDWEDYSIRIHALKSNLKTMGMPELAEKALGLEKASKEDDLDYVMTNHASFMDEYRMIVEKIAGIIT